MRCYEASHPIWPIIRSVVRVIVVGACLSLVYNKVDSRDIITLLIVALGEGALLAGKKAAIETT